MLMNLKAVPLAPAEAFSLAHDETLYLKKMNPTFIMKIYRFFNPTLKRFQYDFLYLHIPLPTMLYPYFIRHSSNPAYTPKSRRYCENVGLKSQHFFSCTAAFGIYPKPLV